MMDLISARFRTGIQVLYIPVCGILARQEDRCFRFSGKDIRSVKSFLPDLGGAVADSWKSHPPGWRNCHRRIMLLLLAFAVFNPYYSSDFRA